MNQPTDCQSKIELAKDFLNVHNINIVTLARALGYVAVPAPPITPKIAKFEDVFKDPGSGKVCRYGGPWREWVIKRIAAGYAFEDLVIDKAKTGLLLELYHKPPKS